MPRPPEIRGRQAAAPARTTDRLSPARCALLLVSSLVFWFGAGGASAQVCPDLQDIGPEASANGALELGDCTLDSIGLDSGDSSLADLYRVTLDAGGNLSVGVQSSEFDTFVFLYDETLTVLLAVDDNGGGGTNSETAPTFLLPGSYVIVVNTFDDEKGAYTVSTMVDSAAHPECSITEIDPSDTKNGSLTGGDCSIAGLGLDPEYGSFVDLYRVDLAPDGGLLTVDLDSPAFDAFLWVYDETLSGLIALDNDSGEGTDARTGPTVLFPGKYLILVKSLNEGEVGSYTLSTTLDPSPGNPCLEVTDLEFDGVANGALTAEDCTLATLGLDPSNTSSVDTHRVTLTTSTFMSVLLEALDFEANVELYDGVLSRFIAADDDGGEGTDAFIDPILLLPGSYLVLANSVFSEEIGVYSLHALPEPSSSLLQLAGLCTLIALRARRGASQAWHAVKGRGRPGCVFAQRPSSGRYLEPLRSPRRTP